MDILKIIFNKFICNCTFVFIRQQSFTKREQKNPQQKLILKYIRAVQHKQQLHSFVFLITGMLTKDCARTFVRSKSRHQNRRKKKYTLKNP